ncbi:prepilin-type N-terminal cleavage/methylation domain-containing protein [Candidatus Uhrbacteria bacterium]|nr:prepilin-type N-terminal cleavage/methylation domain-containing protein [Candidatus Uhrbacteria bacterium]
MKVLKAKSCKLQTQRAFTLIESMLYCALLAILLVALFQVSRSVLYAQWSFSDNLSIQRDAEFVQQKIYWLLQHSASIQTPSLNSNAQHLRFVIDNNGRHAVIMQEDTGDLIIMYDGVRSILIPANQNIREVSISRSAKKLTVSFAIQNTAFINDYDIP